MGRRLEFDTETDGLLDKLTRIHSLAMRDVDTGEKWSCYPQGQAYKSERGANTDLSIEAGLAMLMEADLVIGHNIIAFDIPAIQKVYPRFKIAREKIFDTLVMSRLIWTDLQDRDFKNRKFPKQYAGRHSLEAWGHRLNLWKGDYSAIFTKKAKELGLKGQEIVDFVWGTWRPEMQDYCEQDVEVTDALFKLIERKNVDPRAVEIEHEVALICFRQEQVGFTFDRKAAEELTRTLQKERVQLTEELQGIFKPWLVSEGEFTPKRPNKKMGYWGHKDADGNFHGYTCTKIKQVQFNPASRDHIADRLMKLKGWKPKEYTDKGKPKVDEKVLSSLKYPEAKPLARFMLLNKRIGQIAEGNKAWLKLEKNGKMHGRIVTGGAVTGRGTHKDPNMSAVPKVGAEYGKECRSCFTSSPGRVLVGTDADGLELRMLAHFMARYDGGAYAKQVVEGDAHWENVLALGLVPPGTPRNETKFYVHKIYRDGAKTFIYGFLYGAGSIKVASIVLEIGLKEARQELGDRVLRQFFQGRRSVSERQLAKIGTRLKEQFLKRNPALKKVVEGVEKAVEKRGRLIGLDGRFLHIRSPHAALNTLLQSAGALVCKRWMIEIDREIEKRGWRNRVEQVAWSHDELQFDCDPEIAEELGKLSNECVQRAGTYLNVRVPLAAGYDIGSNWAETH